MTKLNIFVLAIAASVMGACYDDTNSATPQDGVVNDTTIDDGTGDGSGSGGGGDGDDTGGDTGERQVEYGWPDEDGDGVACTESPRCPLDGTDENCLADEPEIADCDDSDLNVHPGAAEVCNGIDDNCDGVVDEGVTLSAYIDNDGDGFGGEAVTACELPTNTVSIGGDCNDNDADIHPDARETVTDGIDSDCDGDLADAETGDTDGDGTNDWEDDTVVEMYCGSVYGDLYSNRQEWVDMGDDESSWYSTTGWWGSVGCYELNQARSILVIEDSLPDQDVWSGFATVSYNVESDWDEDDYEAQVGVTFGYRDSSNYSLLYLDITNGRFVFEQYVAGVRTIHETVEMDADLPSGYLAEISWEITDEEGTPMLYAVAEDTISSGTPDLGELWFELDSFDGNLEGQFGFYSDGLGAMKDAIVSGGGS